MILMAFGIPHKKLFIDELESLLVICNIEDIIEIYIIYIKVGIEFFYIAT